MRKIWALYSNRCFILSTDYWFQ